MAKRKPRSKISYKLKIQLLDEAESRCYYCGTDIEGLYFEIDHLIPVSKGGHQTDHENLVASCIQCNRSKSSMLVEEYRSWLKPYIKEYHAINYLNMIDAMGVHPFGDQFKIMREWFMSNASIHEFYAEKIGKKKLGKYE